MSKNQDPSLTAHLFICTHLRENAESCGGRGSAELRDRVKAACKSISLQEGQKIRVNSAGCLGHCEKGIVAVLYPEGKWRTHLSKDNAELLVEDVRASLEDVSK